MVWVIVDCISRSFVGLFPVGHPRTRAGAALRLAQESTVSLPKTFRFPTRCRLCHTSLFVGDVADGVV